MRLNDWSMIGKEVGVYLVAPMVFDACDHEPEYKTYLAVGIVVTETDSMLVLEHEGDYQHIPIRNISTICCYTKTQPNNSVLN